MVRKVIFQTLDKINMTRNKNRLFVRHFETVQHFICFPRIMGLGFYIAYIYGKFHCKIPVGKWFSQGSSMELDGKLVFLGVVDT